MREKNFKWILDVTFVRLSDTVVLCLHSCTSRSSYLWYRRTQTCVVFKIYTWYLHLPRTIDMPGIDLASSSKSGIDLSFRNFLAGLTVHMGNFRFFIFKWKTIVYLHIPSRSTDTGRTSRKIQNTLDHSYQNILLRKSSI